MHKCRLFSIIHSIEVRERENDVGRVSRCDDISKLVSDKAWHRPVKFFREFETFFHDPTSNPSSSDHVTSAIRPAQQSPGQSGRQLENTVIIERQTAHTWVTVGAPGCQLPTGRPSSRQPNCSSQWGYATSLLSHFLLNLARNLAFLTASGKPEQMPKFP